MGAPNEALESPTPDSLGRESGIDAVHFADAPTWYLGTLAHAHLVWRRAVAFELGLVGLRLARGFLVGRL